MKHTRTLLLLSLLAMTGCASTRDVRPYNAPTGSNTAGLQIRSEQISGYVFLNLFDNAEACRYPHELTGIKDVMQGKKINASTTLRGDQPETLWLNTFTIDQQLTCRIMITFEPKSKHNYLATIHNEREACQLGLLDITDPVDPVPVKKQFYRAIRSVVDITGSHCRPADLQAELAKAENATHSATSLDDLRALLPRPARAGEEK
ncbi:hypothetical protein ACFONG_13615 [Uliginosibacterium paludis]|uniref:Lipoprotein n=1 Tax=Uliginosibacterium paludis TaxID=1615952 RepID=A0ABV2CPM9_9RHOO